MQCLLNLDCQTRVLPRPTRSSPVLRCDSVYISTVWVSHLKHRPSRSSQRPIENSQDRESLLRSELKLINKLLRLTEASWSPTLKAYARSFALHRAQLRRELRERFPSRGLIKI